MDKTSLTFWSRLRADTAGATAIEYGLIASLIVIASIGAFNAVADENTGMWTRVATDTLQASNESVGP